MTTAQATQYADILPMLRGLAIDDPDHDQAVSVLVERFQTATALADVDAMTVAPSDLYEEVDQRFGKMLVIVQDAIAHGLLASDVLLEKRQFAVDVVEGIEADRPKLVAKVEKGLRAAGITEETGNPSVQKGGEGKTTPVVAQRQFEWLRDHSPFLVEQDRAVKRAQADVAEVDRMLTRLNGNREKLATRLQAMVDGERS